MESQPTLEKKRDNFTPEDEAISKELSNETINTLAKIQNMEAGVIEAMPAEEKKFVVECMASCTDACLAHANTRSGSGETRK